MSFLTVLKKLRKQCNYFFTLKKLGRWGKDRLTVFIKKKKPSPGLENPRTPVSPARGFFKINPIIRSNEESNLGGCDHTSAPLAN
jgi:hypothetical protein